MHFIFQILLFFKIKRRHFLNFGSGLEFDALKFDSEFFSFGYEQLKLEVLA